MGNPGTAEFTGHWHWPEFRLWDAAEASAIVDKIIGYASSLGSWRNEISFIADDEDGNLHLLRMPNRLQGLASLQGPLFHQNKIYLDAYQQESSAGGNRYPAANTAIGNKM
jgi:hypothetical protein